MTFGGLYTIKSRQLNIQGKGIHLILVNPGIYFSVMA